MINQKDDRTQPKATMEGCMYTAMTAMTTIMTATTMVDDHDDGDDHDYNYDESFFGWLAP